MLRYSYWYPKVKDCGIKIADSKIIQVPQEVQRAFYMSDSGLPKEEWTKLIKVFFESKVYPEMTGKFSICSNKNSTFSNKFNYVSCVSNEFNILSHMLDINYSALLLGAGGLDEIVLREWIPTDARDIPTIYNGMPLRPEFRIMYDFDTHSIISTHNYWDWEYCHDSIVRNVTDKIVYESYYEKLNIIYLHFKEHVETLIKNNMPNVKELNGKWSIDIMYDELHNDFWLIDLATYERSAYR